MIFIIFSTIFAYSYTQLFRRFHQSPSIWIRRLGWDRAGWAGLARAGLGWAGLGWRGLGRHGLARAGPARAGPARAGACSQRLWCSHARPKIK